MGKRCALPIRYEELDKELRTLVVTSGALVKDLAPVRCSVCLHAYGMLAGSFGRVAGINGHKVDCLLGALRPLQVH